MDEEMDTFDTVETIQATNPSASNGQAEQVQEEEDAFFDSDEYQNDNDDDDPVEGGAEKWTEKETWRNERAEVRKEALSNPPRYVEPAYQELPRTSNESWDYAMRRSMQEIVSGVFLGPYAAASKSAKQSLVDNGITHIVCVRSPAERKFLKTHFETQFRYMVIELEDKQYANIIRFIQPLSDFIKDALAWNGKVLIHGNCGTSRAPALLIGYLMNRFGITMAEAYKFVESTRMCLNINPGFTSQLHEYEVIYRAQHLIEAKPKETDPDDLKLKRNPPMKRSVTVEPLIVYNHDKEEYKEEIDFSKISKISGIQEID